MRAVVCLAFAMFASGCGLAAQMQHQSASAEAWRRHEQEVRHCQIQHGSADVKPVTPRVRCLSDSLDRAHRIATPTDMDIVSVGLADRLVAAERYDRGEMTAAEYTATYTRIGAQVQGVLRQRQEIAHQRMLQQQAMSNAMIMQGAAIIAAGNPTPAPPPPPPMRLPRDTHCTTYGNTTRCSTW